MERVAVEVEALADPDLKTASECQDNEKAEELGVELTGGTSGSILGSQGMSWRRRLGPGKSECLY